MTGAPLPSRLPCRRRKLRKGTFSCRECKARKRRCEFPAGQSECTGCQRRGLLCVSQENEINQTAHRDTEGSIKRVEGLVAELMHQRKSQTTHPLISTAGLAAGGVPSIPPRGMPRSSISITTYLQAVFPSPSEVSLILCNSKSSRIPTQLLWSGTRQQTINETERPPSGAHPIWFGKSLMQFALCLQDSETLPRDGSRFADIVSRNITSLDVMIDSVEGIELLMIEAIYYVNADNRQVAWLKCRRAISIAQMLGIDRGDKGDYANSLWFRLLYGDRIISMELGLPHIVLTADLQDSGGLERRLENTHVALSARIVARNLRMQQQNANCEEKETRDIERRLREAMKDLPAGWWSITLNLSAIPENNAMTETARLITQMNHFWLVVNIYQPYLANALLFPNESEETLNMQLGSTIASREVLRRFLPLRKYHHGTFYHGLDFKAYSASINLLLAHILARSQSRPNALHSDRNRDLHLVTEVLKHMDDVKMAASTGLTIRDLCRIDSALASGTPISWTRDNRMGQKLHIPFVGTLTALTHGNLAGDLPTSTRSSVVTAGA